MCPAMRHVSGYVLMHASHEQLCVDAWDMHVLACDRHAWACDRMYLACKQARQLITGQVNVMFFLLSDEVCKLKSASWQPPIYLHLHRPSTAPRREAQLLRCKRRLLCKYHYFANFNNHIIFSIDNPFIRAWLWCVTWKGGRNESVIEK